MDSYTYVSTCLVTRQTILTDGSTTHEEVRPPADSYRRRSPGKCHITIPRRCAFRGLFACLHGALTCECRCRLIVSTSQSLCPTKPRILLHCLEKNHLTCISQALETAELAEDDRAHPKTSIVINPTALAITMGLAVMATVAALLLHQYRLASIDMYLDKTPSHQLLQQTLSQIQCISSTRLASITSQSGGALSNL